MRGTIIKLVLLAAVSVVMLQGAIASANTVSVPLSQTSFGDMVVDDANQHVFVSNPSGNSITVFDFDGTVVATIPNLPDAYGMVIVGSTLYVAEESVDTIEAVNLTTFADEGPLATGLEAPGLLFYAGGELWTVGEGDNAESVTLGGQVTAFDLGLTLPLLATSPATPNTLYAASILGSVVEFDVSSGTPVRRVGNTNTNGSPLIHAMAISPDATRVIPSSLKELSASTLGADGTIYSTAGASALAVSPGDGGLLAVGAASAATAPADISVFGLGVPTPTFMAATSSGAPNVVANGIGLSADGSRLFAVTSAGSSFRLWSFDLSGAPTSGGDYTWDAASGPGNISDAPNWSNHSSVSSGNVGTLTFPNLAGSCASCESVLDNVPGLVANAVVVNADGAYQFTGTSALTLESGGITVTSPSGSGSPPTFGMPILVAAPQTWTVDEAPVKFTGQIVGGQSLALDFDGGAVEPKSIEVGESAATGDGFIYLDGSADFNSSDGSSVDVSNGAGIEADKTANSVGPVTVDSDGWVSVGGIDNGGGALAIDGDATFNAGSELDLGLDAPGTTVGVDYSQLTATGDVGLNGAELNVSLGPNAGGNCSDLQPGQTLTLVSVSGTINGTFSNYSNGAAVDIENDCDYSTQDASGTINYSTHTVTLTITKGGDAAEWNNGPIEVSPPSLSGSPVVGQTLELNPGSWEQATSYQYSWYACGTATCTQIPGANATSFQLTSAQLGDQIGAVVTAVGPDGPNSDQTDLTGIVTATGAAVTKPTGMVTHPSSLFAPFPKLVPKVIPAIRGAVVVGSTLSTTTGAWGNSPSSFAYKWERCLNRSTRCAPIAGADRSTYTLRSADVGATIEVSVTAKNSAGTSQINETSKPTAIVTAAGSPASAPGVSSATIKNDLRGLLKPTGPSAALQMVLKHHSYAFSFKAPTRGKLTVTWTAKVKNRTVTLAKGSVTISSARKVNVPVRLTGTGTNDLKRFSHLKIKSEVSFTATGLKQVNESATFTLAGAKTAHASSNLTPKQLPRSAFTHRN